jgi:signal transduction histidine kinase
MTIRLRLSLLFTLLVSVLLVGFALVVYSLLSVERGRDFDELMLSRAMLAGIVALEQNEVDSVQHAATVRRFERSALPEEQIVVISSTGNVVFRENFAHSGSVSVSVNTPLKPNETALRQARMGTTVWQKNIEAVHSVAMRANTTLRSVYLPYDDENERFIIVLHATDKDGEQTLADTAWTLMIVVFSSVLVVFGAGWFFAVRMLMPVEAMTRLAEDISATNLAQRLPEGNGRDELAHLARAFNATFVRLERAFTAQKNFVAHASHEIRTPLTAIIGEIGVALSQSRSEAEYRETLDSVLEGALQMRQMASDLLQLARVESGSLVQEFTPCAMDEIVLSAVELVQTAYPARRIIPEIPTSEGQNGEQYCTVLGNVDILRSVVVNVLDNALKYSLADNPVSVVLTSSATEVSIIVQDKGVGISSDEQERVFEPFFRSDRTRERPGTGVGLAFVAEAVRLHGGTVRLTSKKEQGTLVTITLPHDNRDRI